MDRFETTPWDDSLECTEQEEAEAGVIPPQSNQLQRVFRWWARVVVGAPIVWILLTLATGVACSIGVYRLDIISNPQSIWVPPGSTTAQQQEYFSAAFDPFFRINQAIFTRKPSAQGNSSFPLDTLRQRFLVKLLDWQTAIAQTNDSHGTVLDDLCFKPIRGKGCMIESPTNYWASNRSVILSLDAATIQSGIRCKQYSESAQACTSSIGVPVLPTVVLGGTVCSVDVPGFDVEDAICGGCGTAADALVVTFLLQDTPEVSAAASRWEKEVFLKKLEEFEDEELHVTYMAQRSVQDQLKVVESQNEFVIVVSYVVMFAYIVLALGRFPHVIRSRVTLGFQGIVIVGLSVLSSLGIVSFCGMSVTMIVSEVVPFLILAIGVDNMFILAKSSERVALARRCHTDILLEAATPEEARKEACAVVEETLAEVGPTISAAALGEVCAFAVGASTNIPALQQFSIVAAVAVAFNFFFQMTWFVAALALDIRRQAIHAWDIACCVRGAPRQCMPRSDTSGVVWTFILNGEYVRSALHKFLAPALFHWISRAIVPVVFLAMLGVSGYGATRLRMGLEQQLVMPEGSYVTDYFNQQSKYGEAGPPAYIVLQDVNYSHPDTADAIQAITEGLGSLQDEIEPPVYNWFGQFQQWSSPDTYRLIESMQDDPGAPFWCPLPLLEGNDTLAERVHQFAFNISIDSGCCQRGGFCGAQFAQDIKFLWKREGHGNDSVWTPLEVMTTRLRTQHVPLRNQEDFIRSMQTTQAAVWRLQDRLPRIDFSSWDIPEPSPDAPRKRGVPGPDTDNQHTTWLRRAGDVAAFPYSLFYVFYEQYDYIRGIAVQNVSLAIAAVFLAVTLVTSPAVAGWVVLMVLCTTIDIVGLMWLWNPHIKSHDPERSVEDSQFGVDINAVSVVNLVTAVGLAVEFSVHIASAFARLRGTRVERARRALMDMGSNVVTGISLTKLLGVLVLAWAPSRLFRLYYFRMYLGIIVMGVFHGLIVLPVLLSWCGPAEPKEGPSAKALRRRSKGQDDEAFRTPLLHPSVDAAAPSPSETNGNGHSHYSSLNNADNSSKSNGNYRNGEHAQDRLSA